MTSSKKVASVVLATLFAAGFSTQGAQLSSKMLPEEYGLLEEDRKYFEIKENRKKMNEFEKPIKIKVAKKQRKIAKHRDNYGVRYVDQDINKYTYKRKSFGRKVNN